MKYRCVVADVDGTLVVPAADRTTSASPRVIEAVKKTQEAGIVFTIATARSLDWVTGLVTSLNLTAPIILDNGARIYDCMVQKYIHNLLLSSSKASEILDILGRFPYKKYIVDEKSRFEYVAGKTEKFGPVVKMMVLHVDPYQASEIYEILSRLPGIKVTKSVSGTNPVKESIHITHNEAAKEIALRKIAELLGINMENIVAIGDSYNDFSLMTAVGFKAAMGNAVPEIKAIADYIAPSYEEDGVADVLEKFIIRDNA
ncbi:MAG: cof family hydrolase [Candidatus Gottesmanbacteria bacterium GW2011_GWA2_43_14]|uniref:Cof family hydrolase n=1 Tax=Candidatus Gottesmanbacteria bacterium GW2011_GWA2_43_14 TaxID=1618443 RepID=A0A0G1GC07_9BACT|nr:MAG: cof family hydrolase [Candidatus Gottesmanbacteria bacterium GW2011_GWA2_43_14]